jgi:putative membrane protein
MKTFNSLCVGSLIGVALLFTTATVSVTTVRADHSEGTPGQFSKSDFKFVKEAALGGMLEVSLGQLAATKATVPGVKQFGQQMVTDHGKAGDRLKQIATAHGATLPMELTPKQQKEVDRLNGLSGADFDKEYVSLMVKDHKKDLKEFEHEAKKADDSDLRTFAADTSSVVAQHYELIRNLDAQLSK